MTPAEKLRLDLEKAIARGGREPVITRGRPVITDVPGPWGALVRACGSAEILAKEVGVTLSTVWRWIHGTRNVSDLARGVIERVAAEHRVPSPFSVLPPPKGTSRLAARRSGRGKT